MSREALVLLVCCCDFRDGAEWLIPSKSLRNAVIWAFPGLLCILRMCAPRRAAAVVRPRGREKSADRRRRILISRLLIIRASVPRWKSPFPAYFKGFPAVSPLIPPYPAFLKYPVSPQLAFSAFRLYNIGRRGQYLVLEGTVLKLERTPLRLRPKAMLMEVEGKALLVVLRNRHISVREGDALTLYIADTAPLYEWRGIHRLHSYLAVVPAIRGKVT